MLTYGSVDNDTNSDKKSGLFFYLYLYLYFYLT